MALTREFNQTVKERAQRDRVFREALFKESINCFLSGDMMTGKALLRDYINATLGFEALSRLTHSSPQSLMRMFSPKGNPRMDNFFRIVDALQKKEGVFFEVKSSI